jgi:hypothetical protein
VVTGFQFLVIGAALGVVGCAEPLHLMDRGASAGVSPYSFWPPPRSSALWLPAIPPAPCKASLSVVVSDLDAKLLGAGYNETRWYPIGSDYQHGFAVTTRLEGASGDADTNAERWSAIYPEPASLRWLTFAQTPTLPDRRRHRAFLIAFTDLPMPNGATAPIWDEQTLMDGPGAPHYRGLPGQVAGRPISCRYRFGAYEYLYAWDEVAERGKLAASGNANPLPAWPPSLRHFAFGMGAGPP